jgi:aminoglycoside/choline kinase family phosphotransferase
LDKHSHFDQEMVKINITTDHQSHELIDAMVCPQGMWSFVKDFLHKSGLEEKDFLCQSIPGDGSKRAFWRISFPRAEISLIGMENTPVDDFSKRENFAYHMIGEHLFKKGIPVPRIYRADFDHGWFIMEDMGKTSLQESCLDQGDKEHLYERVVEILLRLQIHGAKGFDLGWTCQTEKYDQMVMRKYESDYFRDSFLVNYLGLKKHWPELEHSFNHLAETCSKAESSFFLHRDFQSRNIMVSGSRIGILDWQGGRLGPLAYDLASLLIDPYPDLSPRERDHIRSTYVRLLKGRLPDCEESFQRYFPYLALQRNLQILGAFSFLTKVKRKTHFEAYIPRALDSLVHLIRDLRDSQLDILLEVVEGLHTKA